MAHRGYPSGPSPLCCSSSSPAEGEGDAAPYADDGLADVPLAAASSYSAV